MIMQLCRRDITLHALQIGSVGGAVGATTDASIDSALGMVPGQCEHISYKFIAAHVHA